MSWLKKIVEQKVRLIQDDDGITRGKTETYDVEHFVAAIRTRNRRKDESRRMRVKRNAEELAVEAGIDVTTAATRLRDGDPMGKYKS